MLPRVLFAPSVVVTALAVGCTLSLDRPTYRALRRSDAAAMTADVLDCGADGGECCGAGGACLAPEFCVRGECRSDCGSPGQPCCAGSDCAAGGECTPDGPAQTVCAPCGTPGEACCRSGAVCVAGTACLDVGVRVCLPPESTPNVPGGPCVPVAADSCPSVDACAADPCGVGYRCAHPAGSRAGRCVRCGALGGLCCTGELPGLPYACPGAPFCRDQQSPTSRCTNTPPDGG